MFDTPLAYDPSSGKVEDPEHRRERKYVDPRIANPHFIPERKLPMAFVVRQRMLWRQTHSCGRAMSCEEAWSQP